MLTTVGIDPAASSAIAAFVGPHLVAVRAVRCTSLQAMLGALRPIRQAIEAAGAGPDRALVTEAQFLPRDEAGLPDPKRLASVLSIVRNAAHWEMAGVAWQFKVLDQIHPQSWQARFLPRGLDRTARLLAAQAVVADHFPRDRGVSPDEACAVLIALHAHVVRLGDRLPPDLSWAVPPKQPRRRI